MTVRPAAPADAEAACALVQAGFETYARFTPDWSPPRDETDPRWVAEAAAFLGAPVGAGFVARSPTGELDGIAYWRPPPPERASRDGWLPDGHLRWLFVAERRWGAGVAAALHDRVVASMRAHGVRRARLFTPRGQARARAFYARHGWTTRLEPYRDAYLGLEIVEYELHVGSGAT